MKNVFKILLLGIIILSGMSLTYADNLPQYVKDKYFIDLRDCPDTVTDFSVDNNGRCYLTTYDKTTKKASLWHFDGDLADTGIYLDTDIQDTPFYVPRAIVSPDGKYVILNGTDYIPPIPGNSLPHNRNYVYNTDKKTISLHDPLVRMFNDASILSFGKDVSGASNYIGFFFFMDNTGAYLGPIKQIKPYSPDAQLSNLPSPLDLIKFGYPPGRVGPLKFPVAAPVYDGSTSSWIFKVWGMYRGGNNSRFVTENKIVFNPTATKEFTIGNFQDVGIDDMDKPEKIQDIALGSNGYGYVLSCKPDSSLVLDRYYNNINEGDSILLPNYITTPQAPAKIAISPNGQLLTILAKNKSDNKRHLLVSRYGIIGHFDWPSQITSDRSGRLYFLRSQSDNEYYKYLYRFDSNSQCDITDSATYSPRPFYVASSPSYEKNICNLSVSPNGQRLWMIEDDKENSTSIVKNSVIEFRIASDTSAGTDTSLITSSAPIATSITGYNFLVSLSDLTGFIVVLDRDVSTWDDTNYRINYWRNNAQVGNIPWDPAQPIDSLTTGDTGQILDVEGEHDSIDQVSKYYDEGSSGSYTYTKDGTPLPYIQYISALTGTFKDKGEHISNNIQKYASYNLKTLCWVSGDTNREVEDISPDVYKSIAPKHGTKKVFLLIQDETSMAKERSWILMENGDILDSCRN